jgi:hypothetical protein
MAIEAPFAGNPAATPRKLSHFRKVGAGDPMWSGSCIYGLDAQSPSVSEYETLDPEVRDDGLHYRVRDGVVSTRQLQPAAEPTTSRQARVSAHFDSGPASAFFQGVANFRWSGVMQGFGVAPRALVRPRPLHQSNNPGSWGSKELHPATQYKPFPPMGSIVPAYGEMKAL